jgi:hypothetical protein
MRKIDAGSIWDSWVGRTSPEIRAAYLTFGKGGHDPEGTDGRNGIADRVEAESFKRNVADRVRHPRPSRQLLPPRHGEMLPTAVASLDDPPHGLGTAAGVTRGLRLSAPGRTVRLVEDPNVTFNGTLVSFLRPAQTPASHPPGQRARSSVWLPRASSSHIGLCPVCYGDPETGWCGLNVGWRARCRLAGSLVVPNAHRDERHSTWLLHRLFLFTARSQTRQPGGLCMTSSPVMVTRFSRRLTRCAGSRTTLPTRSR